MNSYTAIKILHVISATVLFGTGLGIAFFKWAVDRTRNEQAIRIVAEKVVLADWIFTTPAIVVQAITGLALALTAHFPLSHGWIFYALALYFFAGACWLPVVAIQIRMRDLARECERSGTPLPDRYWHLSRIWFWLGVPAFLSLLAVFWLMIGKPL